MKHTQRESCEMKMRKAASLVISYPYFVMFQFFIGLYASLEARKLLVWLTTEFCLSEALLPYWLPDRLFLSLGLGWIKEARSCDEGGKKTIIALGIGDFQEHTPTGLTFSENTQSILGQLGISLEQDFQ